MNLKKSVLSFMAAGAILAGGFAGAAAQSADDSATQPLEVRVVADGEFDVQFCAGDGNFGVRTLNSSDYGTEPLSTSVTICYTDTLVFRDAFDAHLSAGPFIGANTEQNNSIAASNLTLGQLSIMNSGQWDGQAGPIGEISGLTGNGSESIKTHAGASWVGNPLDAPQHVHTAYAGVGTGGDKYQDDEFEFPDDDRSNAGSWQVMQLLLTVPHTTVTDTYTSTLLIEVGPPAAP